MKKNPLMIGEPIYQKELENRAKQIVKNYAVGRLIVAGDNRYLSGDLLDLLSFLLETVPKKKRNKAYYEVTETLRFATSAFYAPGAAYQHGDTCTLLRNPHIARNEELQLSFYDANWEKKKFRHDYFRHLTDLVMVDSTMLAAERLGGADYDGDMIKTIADPIVNQCVRKNYQYDLYGDLDNNSNLPFLKIPSIQARVQDAKDWRARFQTVRDTFSSRVGQISNAALARSVIAYNENSQAEERQQAREEVETLAILTGLEIDSAKSGVKTDLSPYLGKPRKQKNLFLTYKYRMEGKAGKRKGAWSSAKQARDFLRSTDWEQVDANLERLPYLAWQLEEHTPKLREPSQPDEVLFSFAQDPPVEGKAAPGLLQAGGRNDPGVPAVPGPYPGQHGPCPGAAPPHGCGAHPVRPGPGGICDGGGAIRRLLRPGTGTGDGPAGTNPGTGVAVPASWGAGGLPPGTSTR